MIDEVKELIEQDPGYKKLLKEILENPYIDRQALAEKAALTPDVVEKMLGPLQEKMVVLELASQADSSLESRVPKKIYLVNPELEGDLRTII